MDTASDLPARAAVGDRAAFSALMRETKGPLFRFVRRYVGDEQEAYDLLQDTYAAAWVGIRRYDPSRPFEAWIRTIALNKCRDWSRRRFVRRLIRGGVDLSSPEAMAAAMADEEVVALSEQESRVLHLAAKGFTFDEIAQFMQVSPHTVMTYVKRVYRKLHVRSKVEAIYEARRLGWLRD